LEIFDNLSSMKVKCFGIAKDITQKSDIEIEQDIPTSVGALREWLIEHYSEFNKYKSCMIAVNQAYADDALTINSSDEIAIIPPVSGG